MHPHYPGVSFFGHTGMMFGGQHLHTITTIQMPLLLSASARQYTISKSDTCTMQNLIQM